MIKMVSWNYNDLQNWIDNGCDETITEQVTVLDIRKNNLKKIPKEIRKLTHLKEFNCSENQIKKIPKEISYLTQLLSFCCYKNKIKKIPKEIGNLINLKLFFSMFTVKSRFI